MDDEIFEEEELEEGQQKVTIQRFSLLSKTLPFVRPYFKRLAVVLAVGFVMDLLFQLEPVLFSMLIDYLTGFEENTYTVEEVTKQAIILVTADTLLWMISAFGQYFRNLELRKIGQDIVKDYRDEMFSHILSLSQKQMKTMKIGSFVTRVTNDTQNISTFFSDILPAVIRQVMTLLIILVVTFVMVGYFGFIYLAYLPVVFFISYLFRIKAKKYYRQEKKCVSEMNSFLSESFSGMREIKTYNREDKKFEEFNNKNNNIFNAFLHSQNLFAIFYPFMYFLQMSCVLIILAFGVPSIVSGTLTLGLFSLLYSYTYQFFQPIQQLTQQLNMLQSILTSVERTSLILAMEPEIVDSEDTIDVPSFKGKIEFKNVYFKYEDGQDYVLKNVSFVIYPGKTVAFVGATGAGKSTIISLISRTYEINAGQILIDDIDIHQYSLSCLRRNIGIMLQDVFLFSGTISDNISLGDPKVEKETIIEGAKEVGADSFIERLPDGYDEKVSEKGNNFSAGQRQLISFARTLVYHPSLVLLDEATANIDTETEAIIQTSLKKLRSIGTMVIVAHRLSTIKDADHIFVVSKGEIIEEGNHQELLKLHKTYYNLYRLQNMERNIDKKEALEYAA